MINETTEVSTSEICALAGLSKQRLSQLASAGIIHQNAKDCWPLAATMRALFADARSRSAAHSEAKGRMEVARAKALELKVAREEGKVAPLQDWRDALVTIIGKVVAALVALPHRYTRDLGERARLESLVDELRTEVSNWLEEEASRLEEAGRRSARQRL